jgi:hypothetical protein
LRSESAIRPGGLSAKLKSGIYALSTCIRAVPLRKRKSIYSSLILSHLRLGAIIYGAANPNYLKAISCQYIIKKAFLIALVLRNKSVVVITTILSQSYF